MYTCVHRYLCTQVLGTHVYLCSHLVVSHLFLGQGPSQGCSEGWPGGAIGAMGAKLDAKPLKFIGKRIENIPGSPLVMKVP